MPNPNNSIDKEKDEGIEDMGVGIDPMDELTNKLQDLQVKKPEVPAEPTPNALQIALANFEEKMKTAQTRSRRHNQKRVGMVRGKGVMKKKVMKALKKKAEERKKAKKAMKKAEKKADDEEKEEEDDMQD